MYCYRISVFRVFDNTEKHRDVCTIFHYGSAWFYCGGERLIIVSSSDGNMHFQHVEGWVHIRQVSKAHWLLPVIPINLDYSVDQACISCRARERRKKIGLYAEDVPNKRIFDSPWGFLGNPIVVNGIGRKCIECRIEISNAEYISVSLLRLRSVFAIPSYSERPSIWSHPRVFCRIFCVYL